MLFVIKADTQPIFYRRLIISLKQKIFQLVH